MPLPSLSSLEQLDKLTRLKEILAFKWDCGVPGCDGQSGHVMPNGIKHPYRHARAEQLPPSGDWRAWVCVTGRGWGKTRTAAEWVKNRALTFDGAPTKNRIGIIAPDFNVAKTVCMEGESGLLNVLPPDRIKSYNQSTGTLVLTNSAKFNLFGTNSQVDAEKARGAQFHTLWLEEAATMRYGEVAWDITQFALRLGNDPRIIVTTTPRNVPLVRRLLKTEPNVVITRGSTLDNASNLAASTVEYLRHRYDGTKLGRQELEGELLEGSEGALWTVDMIDTARVREEPEDLERIVVGVDPAGSHRKESDETGIVVVGKKGEHLYVLGDYSGRYSPDEWARKVVEAYHLHQADLVVAERNFGGDMVQATLRNVDRSIRYIDARASRGKAVRAEPIVMLYEQGRVHHVGVLALLEEQQTTWVPPGQVDEEGKVIDSSPFSPDRVDALVWAATHLTQKRVRQITGAYSAA